MTAVEKVLVDMEARGHQYFEDTLRLGRVIDLLNRARIQKEFEERVVADAPRQIERRVAELIDWLIDQDFRQWQAVTRGSPSARGEHASRDARRAGRRHVSRRSRAADRLGRPRGAARRRHLRQAARSRGHRRSGARGGDDGGGRGRRGASGLGTLVTLAASTAAADVTGILLASVVAALGFLVIPARRRKAKAEMKEKVSGAARAAGRRAADGVRARAGAERGAHRAGRRSLQPVRPRRAGALERGPRHARTLRDRARHIPGAPRCIKKASGTAARIDACPVR